MLMQQVQPSRNINLKKKTDTGFTLLEVMIALFIVAISLGGVMKVMGNAAINTSRLSNRTFAQWVALNQMTKLRIEKKWPSFGDAKGKEEMAEREWRWVQKTIKTDDEDVRRVEVSVWNESDSSSVEPFVTVVGFLANPSL